jgi:hypothetical protein
VGYQRHHAIVVTAWGEGVVDARNAIAALASQASACVFVSDVTPCAMNGYQSFLVAPDGSKEGWQDSDEGDVARDAIKAYLRSLAYDDGSTRFGWVEVQFCDDERETSIVDDSDAPRKPLEGERHGEDHEEDHPAD